MLADHHVHQKCLKVLKVLHRSNKIWQWVQQNEINPYFQRLFYVTILHYYFPCRCTRYQLMCLYIITHLNNKDAATFVRGHWVKMIIWRPGCRLKSACKLHQHLGLNSLWSSDTIWWQIWVNNYSGNGLMLDDPKPLPEPMLTYYQRCSAAFICKQFHKNWRSAQEFNP